MASFKIFQLCLVALTMAWSSLACVEFIGDWDLNTGYFWAQIIDNGNIICSAETKYYVGEFNADLTEFTLSGCASGYDVTWNFETNVCGYSYSGFSGSFGTDETQLEANYYQYVANVWGCA